MEKGQFFLNKTQTFRNKKMYYCSVSKPRNKSAVLEAVRILLYAVLYMRLRKYVVEKYIPLFFSVNNGSFAILTSGRHTMICITGV